MKVESLIKRGDYPLVECKYNVDFYSNTLEEKVDETLGDIWRHYIYSKPEPKGISEIMDTNIVRSLIDYELKNPGYDTNKRTNSANSSPDGQRTSLSGNTQSGLATDVPTGDREILATQKETSDDIIAFITWIKEKYPDDKYILNVSQLCNLWIAEGCKNSFNSFLNEQYHQSYIQSCNNVGIVPLDFKSWLLRPLEYNLNSYREEIIEHLSKRKKDILIANIANPSNIEDAFNKAFYLMNTDEFLKYNGTNYYYNIEFDLKYYKAEKFPYKSRKKEDTINAIPLLSSVINQNPNYSFAFLLRGFASYNTGSFKEAIEDYNKFINLVPDDEVGWYLRAKANDASNNYKAAIDDYLKCIDLIKSYSHYPYLSHYRYVFIDREGKIVDLYEKIPIIPILSELYYNLAFVYINLDDYSGAMLNFNRSIEIDSNKFYVFGNRGTLKLNQKDFEGALMDYNKAIEINPKIASLYYNRAKAKANLKDEKGYLEDYNKAIKIDPSLEKHKAMIKNLIIEKTSTSPYINFDASNGIFKIEGRSVNVNSNDFYKPLYYWVDEYISNSQNNINFQLQMELVNADSQKIIGMWLNYTIEKAYNKGIKCSIDWFYDKTDQAIFELGKEIKLCIKFDVTFNLIPR